jgi:hypothetical protein
MRAENGYFALMKTSRKHLRIPRPRISFSEYAEHHKGCPWCLGTKKRMDGRDCQAYGLGGKKESDILEVLK